MTFNFRFIRPDGTVLEIEDISLESALSDIAHIIKHGEGITSITIATEYSPEAVVYKVKD
jgi:hypothetical protein